jgi:general secretion pathway protein D
MTPGGAAGALGDMTFQIVNEYFRARMQLLEEKNRVTVLATPLLLTANNEVSRLFIGEERPLVRNISSQTILTENNVATAPNTTVEFRSVGITLLITANINSDRTVTLRLVQENSAINSAGASIPVVLSGGAVQNVNVDTVSSRVISGTFAAKDKHGRRRRRTHRERKSPTCAPRCRGWAGSRFSDTSSGGSPPTPPARN